MFRSRHQAPISSDSLLAGYNNSILHQLHRRHGNSPFGNEGDPNKGGDPPAPLTLDAIFKDPLFGNALNAAIKDHLGRALPKALEGAMVNVASDLGKVLDEKLASFKPPAPADPKPGDKKDDKATPSPELIAMQRQLDDVNKQLKQSQEAAAKIAQDAKDEKTLGTIKKAMTDAKVRPEFVDMLANNWFRVEGKIVVDENNNVLVKARGEPYPGAGEQDITLPLARGLDEFTKSDLGKSFVQAPTGTHVAPRNAPRIASNPGSPSGGTVPNGGSKIPTFEQDPSFAERLAAELAPNISPTLLG